MVRIDGGRIRQLREEKGLTQLYLSTVVGVTTDTISRWENRHYQSIKKENAEKLAQALDTDLAAILEQEPETSSSPWPPVKEDERPSREARRRNLSAIAAIILAAAAGITLRAVLQPGHDQPVASASRILPPHVPPGQKFPVLIRVSSPQQKQVSLIIKESIPAGCEFLQGVPEVTTIDHQGYSLKWLGRTGPGASLYAYVCRVKPDAAPGEGLRFTGTVTIKDAAGDHGDVTGAAAMTVAPFHWADINRDRVIDDEEILAVYDLYSDIRELNFNRDLIDSIWAGRGYAWDSDTQRYEVLD